MPKRSNLLQLSLFTLVVFSSAIFRITNLDLIEFKADEAINLFLASRPLFDHPFPPGGTVSSISILNPPLFNYLLFPFVIISTDPRFLSFFIGLVNSLAIGAFFLLIKRYYNLSTALIASFLFAFSPWAILFSRKIWAQDLIVPFFILLLIALHKIIIDRKTVYWVLYVVSSLFLLQIHQSTIFFLFLLTIFLLLRKPRLQYKFISIGFVLGIISLLPYIFFQLTSGCFDCGQFLTAGAKFTPQFNYATFFRPFQILSQGNFYSILGEDTLTFARNYPIAYYLRLLFYGAYLLLPIGAYVFWKKFPSFRFLVYMTILLPFVYFSLRIDPQMHYFVILTPLLFLFLGTGISFFIQHKNIFLKFFSFFAVIALILVSISYNNTFFKILNDQKVLKGDYGTSLVLSENETRKVFEKYQNDPFYHEMVIASYIPKYLVHGDIGIARMIYDEEKTQQNLVLLDQRLQEVSVDPRVHNELIALYTKSTPAKETLQLLRNKKKNIKGYEIVYNEVFRTYLAKNFLKEYSHSDFGFSFEYPEHWAVEEKDKELSVSGDGYSMIIRQQTNGQLNIKGKFYTILYEPSSSSTLEQITKSIRELY